MSHKPTLSFSQIISMNVGFLGIQYSFGLQQTAINPIYTMLGAKPDELPLLNLAGPITGLIIQPIIGAMSDKTWSPRWGRRKPFFLIGAILCSLCLFAFPFSSTLWMAAGLLWILDAANNTAMEPYRAFIADQLDEKQQPTGFLAQSFFTGLGITLANFSLYFLQFIFPPNERLTIPYWVYGSFFIGAAVSISSVWFSTSNIQEFPPSDEELKDMKMNKQPLFKSLLHSQLDIWKAIQNMPTVLWQLALVYLFQWYALFCYWQFVSHSIVQSIFHSDATNPKLYGEAVGWVGVMNGSYNIVTFLVAFYLVTLAQKYSPKMVHSFCLLLAAMGLICLPYIDIQYITLIPMIGLGIAWASIMGIPYLIAVPHIPKNQYGIYMGIINMMIVIPMFIQTITFKYIYKHFLDSNPKHAILFAGVFLLIASILTLLLKTKKIN